MTETASTPTVDVLALLTLPAHAGLSQYQDRGQACVWCGVILSAETAVNLGKRRIRLLDTHRNWFPRGCRSCVKEKAYLALFDHAPKCKQCTDDPGCPTAVGLRRLMREGRR